MFKSARNEVDSAGLIVRAAYFAGEKHRMQRRGDIEATPYINHPLELAAILTDEVRVTDVNTICAALLHDTLEDTETTSTELINLFGEDITSLVLEVSNDMDLSSQMRRAYEFEKVPDLSHRAKLIKLADKLANIRDVSTMPPAGWTKAKKNDYFDFALSIAERAKDASPQLFNIFLMDYKHLHID